MKHKILAITIASALGLVGCGGSGSDHGNDGGNPGPSATNFSGTVNKGIVNNGKVEVCDTFDAQGCNSQAGFYLATTTNASGKYSIQGAPLNKPLMVIASKKDNTTTMKCDVETCTDASGSTVGFGKTFVVADGWQLKTILPEANSTTSMVNVTSLTDIAADQALEDAGSGQVTVAIASKAKEAVEEIFGLDSSITELGAVDLTDPSQTQNASPAEINAALYSAAVMSSGIDTDALLQANGNGYTISPSLLDVISDAEKLVNSDSDTALVKASEVSKKELTDLDADWRHGSDGFKDKDGDGKLDPAEIKPQEPIVDKVQAAKSFINDVRTTYMSVQEDGDLSKGVADFGEELEVMAPLVEEDAEKALNNVQQAVEAIVAKFDDKQVENGFDVNVKGTIYTAVRNVSGSEATTVVANLKQVDIVDPEEQSQSSDEGIATATIELEVVSINSTVDNVALTGRGFAKVDGLVDGWSNQNDHMGWSESEDLSINTVALSLEDVKMIFDDSSNGKSAQFDGVISAKVKGLVAAESSSETNDPANGKWEESESKFGTFTSASVMFSGELVAGHDSAGVYLNVVADNSRGFIAGTSSLSSFICPWAPDDYTGCFDLNRDESSPETPEKYVAAYITAQVSTDVQNALNNNVAASVKLEVNRSKYDVADAKVTVGYNDVDTIIEAPVGLYDKKFDSDIIIRNKAGVVATITDYEDTVAGEIKINGEKVATIVEVDNGLVLVRYTDGSFESLF